MREYRILFTGVGRRVELVQAFREAALRQNKRLRIYGTDMAGTAPGLLFCDDIRLVCGMKDESYIDELVAICEKNNIDLLIPTIDTDLLVLAENQERFRSVGTRVMVSSPEMVGICRDKNYTSQFFLECGLNAPMPVNDWKTYHGSFPAFIKPKDGSSSVDAYKVESREALENYAMRIKDYIVQPFIDGTEYTVDIFCDFDGRPVFIIPRIRLAVRAGEVQKTKIDLDGRIIDECRNIIDRFKPCGPITVQLIREEQSGEDYYIEINPRYGGGAPLSMKAGAKSAEVILKLLAGETADSSLGCLNDGAIYSRFDQSVCIQNGKRHQIKGVIFDLDDTLYSEKDYIRSGYRAAAEYLGDCGCADEMWEYFKQGKPAIDECLKRLGRQELKEKCLDVYRFHKPSIQLYKAAARLVEELRATGIKVGIITDGRPESQRNKIIALGLERMVDDIIVTDELGGEQFRKPCDIAFQIMMTRWRLPAESIVYIGDNAAKDFQAPQQLGMAAVWFQNKNGLYQEGECRDDILIVTNIEALRAVLTLNDVLS